MFNLYALLQGLKSLFKTPSYGEQIEDHILHRNPKDTADIERFTIEWQRGQTKERII